MNRVKILNRAIEDILELTEYLAEYIESAGDRLTDLLADLFERLGTYPKLGRPRPDISDHARSIAVNRVRVTVYYLHDEQSDVVLIARVLRQERLYEP